MEARHPPELLEAQGGELDVASHREIRAVHLEQEPRTDHRLVLVPHGVRDGEEVCLVARVVVVPEEEGDHPRRGRRQERFRRPDGGERRLEILGVGLGRSPVAHADRAVAGRRPAPGSPRIAEDALGQLREVHEVPVLERLARAAEPREAILHVGGVARLAELAVVDHVHARVRLLPHDLGHRGPGAGGEGGAVDRHPFLPGEHRPHQVVGPRQAAGVRGEEPIATLSHARHPSATGSGVSGGRDLPRRGRGAGQARGGGRALMGGWTIIASRLWDSTRGLGYHARPSLARRRWYRVVPHLPITGCCVRHRPRAA